MRKSYLMLGSLSLVLCGAIMTGSHAEAAAPAIADIPAQNIREYVPVGEERCNGSWNNHRQDLRRPFHRENRHDDRRERCAKCNDGKDRGRNCDSSCAGKCDRDNDCGRKTEFGRFGSGSCGN